MRVAAALSIVIAVAAVPASAQDWAKKMFPEVTYNFGSVVKGAKTEHHFTFKNLYRDPVHIVEIRASCGCTTPIIVTKTVDSLKEGEIIARFNTDRFTGQRGATLTVVIDKPMPAEVQLRVDGFIRTDVTLQPGLVNFGSVTQGTPVQQSVSIDYSGANNWQVTGVKTDSPYLDARILPPAPGQRRSFTLFVRLKDDAPAGYLQDRVTLLTTDTSAPELPVVVEGRVLPELTVNPGSLALGAVPLGQAVTKQFVVQAKKPFRITGMTSEDESFAMTSDSEAKTWHMVTVTFNAKKAGKLQGVINIQTDLSSTASTVVPVYADVQALATN